LEVRAQLFLIDVQTKEAQAMMYSEINRRDFLGMVGAGAAGLAAPQLAAFSADRKPNIVFILADDMGYNQLACDGNPFYETPHLDKLASQGMRFTDAYSAAPICSPTRASLMTGKYPARLHLTDFIPGNPYPFAKLATPEMSMGLPLEETTIPEMLAKAGYVSGHFGKWHLNVDYNYSPGRPGDPASQGFDEVLTTNKPKGEEAAAAGADPDYDAHHVWEIAQRSAAFIEANKDRPFFCYITHNSIHHPVMEYAPRIAKYAVKEGAGDSTANNPVHGAMVETLDNSVKVVLDKIGELGIADNTIVVFTADNGCYFGREGRHPFYGAKADLYEGGVRVPLIVRWPGQIRPGAVSHEMVSSIDFFPTFAEIAGVELDDPTIDGVSIQPALKGKALERETLYWHYPHYHSHGIAPAGSIREGRYKLIEWYEKSLLEGAEAEGALQLFDLQADMSESRDLVKEMPDRAKEMFSKLCEWRNDMGAQTMTQNPNYNPEKADWRELDQP
jgi:uncharacterized sulfatase